MKKLHVFGALLVALLMGLTACQPNQTKKEVKEYPMFWTWMHYNPKSNFDSICHEIKDMGLDGIILQANTPDLYREAIPVAKKYGLHVYAWVWTLNSGSIAKEHPEWTSVNRNGKNLAEEMAYVGYYKFLCPAIPGVREALKKQMDEFCKVDGLDGFSIDYHRLVDVVLPTTLWPTYGIVQDHEYPQWDYGYHPAMIKKFKEQYGYDPREQEDPSMDVKWRQFRCDQVAEVANELAEVVHSHGKIMAASPFPTPKMASRMVRQDWSKWKLDVVFPMIYHSFYTEDPSFVGDCTLENARDKNENTTLFTGLMLNEGGKDICDCMDEAFNNGAQGIAIFTWDGMKKEYRSQFKAYADSMRAVRAQNGGMIKATYPKVAEMDPFKHEGVMKRIELRMQKLIAKEKGTEELAPLSLGEYKKVKEYDVTKVYEVVDANSKATFEVDFYFYGDVLSGWNLYLKK